MPSRLVSVGSDTIVGVRVEFKEYLDTESNVQRVAVLPDRKIMLAFDLVFAPQDHASTVVASYDHWIGILEELKGDRRLRHHRRRPQLIVSFPLFGPGEVRAIRSRLDRVAGPKFVRTPARSSPRPVRPRKAVLDSHREVTNGTESCPPR